MVLVKRSVEKMIQSYEKDKTGGPVVLLSSPNSRLGRGRQLVLRENTKEEVC